ncbi:hypothetical protein [Natrialbaceae archaeon AArc-T1-2]|uniref:hypothetical protein n=1 Tax=Natrialbaceae archaeon AArc-T1-2 TaxID=3053904 RepID=UPI00255A9B95|nr:hypothetical protein [Natrialbaceae archaeon AArc-T1-2]WIV66774.1 hypothetical protein QQ977_13920 [Natrialbaceae archaeon AArc-T1-2]
MTMTGFLVLGTVLVVLGVCGVRYASTIVAVQHERGIAPIESDEVDDADRVRVTKAVAVLVVLVGLASVGYGLGLL